MYPPPLYYPPARLISPTQTDGLADNVFAAEVISICNLVARAGGPEDVQIQAMADRIVDYARQCMANKQRVSPFESARFSAVCGFVSMVL